MPNNLQEVFIPEVKSRCWCEKCGKEQADGAWRVRLRRPKVWVEEKVKERGKIGRYSRRGLEEDDSLMTLQPCFLQIREKEFPVTKKKKSQSVSQTPLKFFFSVVLRNPKDWKCQCRPKVNAGLCQCNLGQCGPMYRQLQSNVNTMHFQCDTGQRRPKQANAGQRSKIK